VNLFDGDLNCENIDPSCFLEKSCWCIIMSTIFYVKKVINIEKYDINIYNINSLKIN
jgi:hypothetical protein